MKKITKSLLIILIGVFGYLVLPNSVLAASSVIDKIDVKNFVMPEYNGLVADSKMDYSNITLYSGSNVVDNPYIRTNWSYIDENGDYKEAGTEFDKKAMYILELNFDYFSLDYFDSFRSNSNNSGSKYEGTFIINGVAPTMLCNSDIHNNPSGSKISTFKFYFDFREEVNIKDVDFYYYPIVGETITDRALDSNYGKFVIFSMGDNYYKIDSNNNYSLMGISELFAEGYTYLTYYFFNPVYKLVTDDLRIDGIDYLTSSNVNGEKTDIHYKEAGSSPFELIAVQSKALKPSYTVTYDNNNHGIKPNSQIVATGENVIEPEDLTEEEYIFGGWYTDPECTEKYDFSKGITKDITLYAKWTLEYTYDFLNGNKQEFTIGKIDGFTFRVDGNYSKFDSLKIGDNLFEKGIDYEASEGSTIITFLKKGLDKLNALSVGKYTIILKYTNNKTAEGYLTIKDALTPNPDPNPDPKPNPPTGDNIIYSIAVGGISLIGLVVCGFALKKKFN